MELNQKSSVYGKMEETWVYELESVCAKNDWPIQELVVGKQDPGELTIRSRSSYITELLSTRSNVVIEGCGRCDSVRIQWCSYVRNTSASQYFLYLMAFGCFIHRFSVLRGTDRNQNTLVQGYWLN